MNCENSTQVHRYHDGELNASERSAVQAHVAQCAACQQLLAELEQLSEMLLSVPLPDVSNHAMNRMNGSFWAARRAQDMGVRRLASWMTAVAATILIVASASPTQGPQIQDQPVRGAWAEMFALIPPAEASDAPNAELLDVVQWMANDPAIDQMQ